MNAEDRLDPDEYVPDPDSVTAPEEYEPEVAVDDPTREADPADVPDQAIELPVEALHEPDEPYDPDDELEDG